MRARCLWTSLCPFLAYLLLCDGAQITEDAPTFSQSVAEYYESAAFFESVRACCPNSTSFPQLDGASQSPQCLLEPGALPELIEQLGGTLVNSPVALEELNRISAAGRPNIVMEYFYAGSILRTLAEGVNGYNHFVRNEHERADHLQLSVWQMPSPIAIPARLNDGGQQKELILGDTCMDGSLTQKIGTSVQRRRLKAQSSPNNSVIVATARISDGGALAISGAGLDEELWENKLAKAAAEVQGLTSQGLIYPRSYMLLYYRMDWFEELGITSVPNTWDELIALARTMSGLGGFVSTEGVGPNIVPGYEDIENWPNPDAMASEPIELHLEIPREKDMGGNNTRFAVCLDLAQYCQGGYVLNAILASISQTHGTWQNAFMDPVEVELLSVKHPELMKEALRVFRDLAEASHLPTSLHSCAAVSHLFSTGRCAMTMSWEYAFPYIYNGPRRVGAQTADSSNSSKPHPAAGAQLAGNVGVSILPGSSRVYDRAGHVIKECDPSTCPLATQEEVSTYSSSDLRANATKATRSSSSSSSSHGARSNHGGSEGEGGSERISSTNSRGKQSNQEGSQEEQESNPAMDGRRAAWVNRAPYSVYAPGIDTLCNPFLDSQGRETGEYQTNLIAAASRALNDMFLPMIAFEESLSSLLEQKMASLGEEAAILAYTHTHAHKGDLGSAGDELQARKQELLKPPDFSDQELESWWNNGRHHEGQTVDIINNYLYLDITDSRRLFQALWKAMYLYQNQAPDFLATPILTQGYRFAASEVALYASASPTFSLERAVQGFQDRSMDAQNAETAEKQATQAAVWRATGFDKTMLDVASGSSSSSSSTLSRQETTGAIVGPVLFAFLFAILAIVIAVRRPKWHFHHDQRNLLGVVLPPKAGPQTTLLLTDIESSTQMWETLCEHVCDEVMSLHNEVIRKQLQVHHGYECGTQGDAFVLAFHTVADALMFASSAQVELLLADWPAELLELEVCRPVYVPLPNRQQNTFMKHFRKNDNQMPFERQESSSALGKWSSQELALHSTFASTQVSFKQPSLHMEPTSEWSESIRDLVDDLLTKLKACFLCHTRQQKLQAQPGQPHPLFMRRQMSMADDADSFPSNKFDSLKGASFKGASFKGAPEVSQLKGRLSGLLAFDAAMLSTAINEGLLSKKRKESDEETGLHLSPLAKRVSSRSSVTPLHTPFTGRLSTLADSPHSSQMETDPSMIPQGMSASQCVPGLSTVNETSLTADASHSRAPSASGHAHTEQSSSRRVQFDSFLNEPEGSIQDSSCAINSPGPHHANQEFSRSSSADIARSTGLTVGQQYLATMPRTYTPGPGRLLVLRGLRVRMGAASGVERQEDVQLKGAQGRAQYSGRIMAAASAVVDAAQGGMVLISQETFHQIPAKLMPTEVLVASMGEHVLGKGEDQVCMQLYQVLPRQLVHRAPQLGPVRSIHQLSHGFLEAPSSSAAICFVTVSYLKALELWNPDVTAAALKLWHNTVQAILIKRGGYLVEAGDGLCLAALPKPSSAIRWALESIEACLNAEWPRELLETELGEEQYYTPFQQRRNFRPSPRASDQSLPTPRSNAPMPSPRLPEPSSGSGPPHPHPHPLPIYPHPHPLSPAHLNDSRVLLFRGLRMKVGIDWGAVKADLHAATARVTFRGRVMNRAARISGVAKLGQVWCSEGAWEAAAEEINSSEAFPDEVIEGGEDLTTAGPDTVLRIDEDFEAPAGPRIPCVHATPLGRYNLKGIAQNVELYHCY